jgi:hypothetical protein
MGEGRCWVEVNCSYEREHNTVNNESLNKAALTLQIKNTTSRLTISNSLPQAFICKSSFSCSVSTKF